MRVAKKNKETRNNMFNIVWIKQSTRGEGRINFSKKKFIVVVPTLSQLSPLHSWHTVYQRVEEVVGRKTFWQRETISLFYFTYIFFLVIRLLSALHPSPVSVFPFHPHSVPLSVHETIHAALVCAVSSTKSLICAVCVYVFEIHFKLKSFEGKFCISCTLHFMPSSFWQIRNTEERFRGEVFLRDRRKSHKIFLIDWIYIHIVKCRINQMIIW